MLHVFSHNHCFTHDRLSITDEQQVTSPQHTLHTPPPHLCTICLARGSWIMSSWAGRCAFSASCRRFTSASAREW
jgi:hypothetical protein